LLFTFDEDYADINFVNGFCIGSLLLLLWNTGKGSGDEFLICLYVVFSLNSFEKEGHFPMYHCQPNLDDENIIELVHCS
jgi:hypothetical protein